MNIHQNSYETVISYNNQNKINFNHPAGTPILSLQRLMDEGRLELKDWFQKQKISDYTILLKGSRGMYLEKLLS